MEKRILTLKEWEEIQHMQAQAKARKEAERKLQEEQAKTKKRDEVIGALMILFIGGVLVFMFSPVLAELLKTL